MILNGWQNFFLTKLIPTLESLGSAVDIFAFIVLFILLPALVYSCKKIIDGCYTELKRQTRLLQSQTQSISELNIWMQYFDEKIIKREYMSQPKKTAPVKVPSPEKIKLKKVISPEKRDSLPKKRSQPGFPSTPVSIYKKTI